MKLTKYYFFLVFLCSSVGVYAQQDTSYYVSYVTKLTTRFYISRKFTTIKLLGLGSEYKINYRPNTTWNIGFGLTYKWATINLAYGFGFLNPDLGQGKTKYLDLQFHNYGEKYVLDVLGQFYKGFYLSPKDNAGIPHQYYVRKDMGVNLVGISLHYVFNNKRFSYRSSYFQNEWQKKSAGTFLLGVETYIGSIKTDSSIVPQNINTHEASRNITSYRFFEMGPNAGYAYTFVFKKNFFITASGAISIATGINNVTSIDGNKNYYGVFPNTIFRFATGYNSKKWAISLVYINSAVHLANSADEKNITINTSNVRLNFVRRFSLNKKFKKILKPMNSIQMP